MREYLGTLDDVAERYQSSADARPVDVRHILLEQFLYGAPGLLNDGYLVQHRALRSMLLRRDPLLIDLLDHDFLTVASTLQPPSRSIEYRAARGVTTHADLVRDENWPALAAAIDNLPNGQSAGWPSRDLTAGFGLLSARLLENLRKELQPLPVTRSILVSFLERFLRSLATQSFAPRTLWEKLVLEDETVDPATSVTLMSLANLIYHFNFTTLLAADHGEDSCLVTPGTPFLPLLLDASVEEQVVGDVSRSFGDGATTSEAGIQTVRSDPRLIAAKSAFRQAPGSPELLASYVDALRAREETAPMIVQPASFGRLDIEAGQPVLRTTTYLSKGCRPPHIRLKVPTTWIQTFAASVSTFSVE